MPGGTESGRGLVDRLRRGEVSTRTTAVVAALLAVIVVVVAVVTLTGRDPAGSDPRGDGAAAGVPPSSSFSLGSAVSTAGTSPADATTSPSTTSGTSSSATPSRRRSFPAGMYAVGSEIAPGTYHWSGSAGTTYCAWLRVTRRNPTPADIQSFVSSEGDPLTQRVAATDLFIEVQGSCTFVRD